MLVKITKKNGSKKGNKEKSKRYEKNLNLIKKPKYHKNRRQIGAYPFMLSQKQNNPYFSRMGPTPSSSFKPFHSLSVFLIHFHFNVPFEHVYTFERSQSLMLMVIVMCFIIVIINMFDYTGGQNNIFTSYSIQSYKVPMFCYKAKPEGGTF